MNASKTYIVQVHTLRHNGKRISAGETVELTDKEAAQMLRINAISAAVDSTGTDMLEFADVFGRLGKDDLTKEGMPKVASVNAALGRKVTTEEVAAAWTAWQAAKQQTGGKE